MGKKHNSSIVALLLSLCVCAYLILLFTKPSGSYLLMIVTVAFAIASPIFAVIGIKQGRTALTISIAVFSCVSSCVMILVFLLMMMMGL